MIKVQVLNTLQSLQSDLGGGVRVLLFSDSAESLQALALLMLKSDPNSSKLFLLIFLPHIWSIISLRQALNFGSSACTQLLVHEQSEKTSAVHRESQWSEESGGSSERSPGGCSLNIRLFAFCSGSAEHKGKPLNRVFLFRILWVAEFD